MALGRVLLKGNVGSAAHTFVDPVWVGRGERTMAEKRSTYLHQSSGKGENDVRKIENLARTNDSVLLDAWRACSIGPRSITTCAHKIHVGGILHA